VEQKPLSSGDCVEDVIKAYSNMVYRLAFRQLTDIEFAINLLRARIVYNGKKNFHCKTFSHSDSTFKSILRSFAISFARYSPIPVAFFLPSPELPVKPFSKIYGKSELRTPIPLSLIDKT